MRYTWDEIYERAEGAAYGEPALRAKDEARWQVRWYAIDHGEDDLEELKIPEYGVEDYVNKYNIMFDEYGNIIEANGEE